MDDLITEAPGVSDAPTTGGSAEGSRTVSPNVRPPRDRAPVDPVVVLPDVALGRPDVPGTLDRVGMSNIEVVLRDREPDGTVLRVPGRADITVDLADPDVKGIHMSRLYLLLQAGFDDEPFGPTLVDRLLRDAVASQTGSSAASRIAVRFDHTRRRPSLLSEHSGWRSYPVRVASELRDGRVRHEVTVEITYSSTCPCSAALSRQLLQDSFDRRFGGRSSVPTESVHTWLGTAGAIGGLPHAQRSEGEVTVVWAEDAVPGDFGLGRLVDLAEQAVATPVQAVVKRVDEQDFARLNAENPMFCEDAARRLRATFDSTEGVADYRIAVRHLESLHPHDAVAVVTKGVPGGLVP